MNEGLCIYMLLNRHIVSTIIAIYRLTDSKNKIIKYYYYYLDKKAQSIYAKTQPNVQPMSI